MAEENVVVDAPAPAGDKPADKPVTDSTGKPDASVREPKPAQKDPVDARYEGTLADLKKERKARQDAERRAQEYEGTLAAERKRIKALVGVETPSDDEAEAAAIRERFAKIYPELAGLTKEDIEALRDLRQQSGDLKSAVQNHWDRHVGSVLGQLEDLVSDSIGADLTDRQKRTLRTAYAAQVQDDPEFAKAYEAGDPAHLEQFAKEFVEDWFKPAQRKTIATELDRQRRVPSGRDRSVAQTPEKQIDVNDPKAVEDFLAEGFLSRGGQKGRRR